MGLSEADTRVKLIDPLLWKAGWDEKQIQREYQYKAGRLRLLGQQTIRDKPKYVDYVLRQAPRGQMLAVVEAKDEDHLPSAGLQQALQYATDLGVYFAYSTNGHGIVEHDRLNNRVTERKAFPSPEELTRRLAKGRSTRGPYVTNAHGDKVPNPIIQPAWAPPAGRGMRWYQEAAVTAVLDAMLDGKHRALLSLATGTGKTFVAFNLCWKLFQSGYIKKALFLADRVALRDQAFNEFGPFGTARGVAGGGNAPLARDVHFATYQALYARGDDGRRLYERYPRDFFDLVIIDECHRSGYGDWQVILNHFDTAFHLGMTATPKRSDNIDTYEFFASENRDESGNPRPVFEYSLARGIDDGYLATYRVRRVRTDLDERGLRIEEELEQGADLMVPEGATVKDVYWAPEFERAIVVEDRTRLLCEHLAGLLRTWGPNEKTMVFCVTMEHAAQVRDHLQNLLGPETGKQLYAARIVSEEADSQALLEQFQLSSSQEPVVATTVDLLTTGVNVPSVRNIVFMKPISSPTVFKQIIGRGSRLDEATGKEFFRIVDYTNATRLLDAWDIPPSGDAGDVPLAGRGILSGKVVEHGTGNPIPNAALTVRASTRSLAEATTDARGLFHITDLPEIVLTLNCGASGYARRTMRVLVTDQTEELVIALPKPAEGAKKLVISGVTVRITEEAELTLRNGQELTAAQYLAHAGERIRRTTTTLRSLTDQWRSSDTRKRLRDALSEQDVTPAVLATLLDRPDADEYDILANVGYEATIRSREERARSLEHSDIAFLRQYNPQQRQVISTLLDKYRVGGVDEIATAEVFGVPPFVDEYGGIRGLVDLFGGTAELAALLKGLQTHLYPDPEAT